MKLAIPFLLFQMSGIKISGEIILALIAIGVAIIFGIPAVKIWRLEKNKLKLKHKTLFKESGWINVSLLTYSSLDGIRVMHDEQNPSYQNGISEKIRKILDERKEERQNHVLLVGPSLSGKTHITVSVLNNLPDSYILIPNEDTFNQAANDSYELPNAPDNAQYRIVLLDNFHEFFKGGATTPKALIHKAIDKGFTLWANCISIEEYARVKSLLDFKDSDLGVFQEIELDKKLTIKETEDFAQRLKLEKLLPTFNGLMGEFFYPPADMLQHFEDIKSDVVTLDVLLFIKQAYMLGAFTIPYLMKLELLKKAFAKKYSVDFIPLMNSLKKIEQKGFIKLLYDHTFFSFDSVWLNEIVVPEMKPKEFLSYWIDIIQRNVVQYNYLIASSKDYFEAKSYYIEMIKGGIVPNKYTYTTLISLSPDYDISLSWYNKIEVGKADVYTYNSLISKSPNYETALCWYKKIEKDKTDLITYSSIISKSPNYETALEWYNKIEKGKANVFTYGSLIHLSPDYETALEWFDKIDKDKVNIFTYGSLINLSPDYKTALEWYNKVDEDEVTVITLNSLISKSPDYYTALKWYDKISDGKADVYTYNSLIRISLDYKIALEWYNKIETEKADVITYSSLISRSPDYETALEWYKKIETGKANVITYSSLIFKSPDYETALEWYKKIETGKANVITYNSLINLSPNYETAFSWYRMIEEGKNTVITYSSLISKSPNYETALEWYKKIETGKANVITYSSLIFKSPDYETALEWYKKIETGKATVITYNSLISKSPDYETALVWYKKIEKGKATVITYNSIIGKSTDINIAMDWLRKMRTDELPINDYTYGSLIKVVCKSRNNNKYQRAISIHDEMLENGISSSVAIYTLLISLSPDFEQAFKLLKLMITKEDKNGERIIPNERTRKKIEYKAYGKIELLNKVDKWFMENTPH